jgi:hypothetical protein
MAKNMDNNERKPWTSTRTDRQSAQGGYRGRLYDLKQGSQSKSKGQDYGENFDGDYQKIMEEANNSKTIDAEQAEWLHEKLDRSGEQSPDLATAPMGTDQEAGGAITTPSGRRKYSEGEQCRYEDTPFKKPS